MRPTEGWEVLRVPSTPGHRTSHLKYPGHTTGRPLSLRITDRDFPPLTPFLPFPNRFHSVRRSLLRAYEKSGGQYLSESEWDFRCRWTLTGVPQTFCLCDYNFRTPITLFVLSCHPFGSHIFSHYFMREDGPRQDTRIDVQFYIHRCTILDITRRVTVHREGRWWALVSTVVLRVNTQSPPFESGVRVLCRERWRQVIRRKVPTRVGGSVSVPLTRPTPQCTSYRFLFPLPLVGGSGVWCGDVRVSASRVPVTFRTLLSWEVWGTGDRRTGFTLLTTPLQGQKGPRVEGLVFMFDS